MTGEDPQQMARAALAPWSNRPPTAKALELARRQGITVTPDMTRGELRRLIDESPANPAQLRWVSIVLEYVGLPMPQGLTFGQASRVLSEVLPSVDERVLMEQGWEVGSVLTWHDKQYRIINVRRDYRVVIVPAGDEAEQVQADEKRHHSPLVLLLCSDDPSELQLDDAMGQSEY